MQKQIILYHQTQGLLMATIEFGNFPLTAHTDYAYNQEYSQKTQSPLDKYTRNLPSIPGTLSKASPSNLLSIPFFQAETLGWSLFPAAPLTRYSLSYFFSDGYYSKITKAYEKAQNFALSKNEKIPEQLHCFFSFHEVIEKLSNLINSQRTVQKA